MGTVAKTMKPFCLYPDRMLCFFIGFLPTGLWVGLLAVVVDVFSKTLSKEPLSTVPLTAAETFFSYGLMGGVLGLLLGYLLRKVQPNSHVRWVWLSFVIPQFTFAAAAYIVELVNMIQCGDLGAWPTPTLDGICVYQGAAVVAGIWMVCQIGVARWILRHQAWYQ